MAEKIIKKIIGENSALDAVWSEQELKEDTLVPVYRRLKCNKSFRSRYCERHHKKVKQKCL